MDPENAQPHFAPAPIEEVEDDHGGETGGGFCAARGDVNRYHLAGRLHQASRERGARARGFVCFGLHREWSRVG